MSKISVVICLLLLPLMSSAQSVDTAVMAHIRDQAFNHSMVAEFAHQLTDIAGPRLTNSPGYFRATDYAVKALGQMKLNKATKESWGYFGKGWSNEKTVLTLKVPYTENIIAYPVAWTKGTTGPAKTVQVILLDSLDSAIVTAKSALIKGKIVMIKSSRHYIPSPFENLATRHSDSTLTHMENEYMFTAEEIAPYVVQAVRYSNTIKYLEKKGAVALLIKSRFRDGTVGVEGSNGYAKGYDAPLPNLMIAPEDYLQLERIISDGRPVELEIDVKNSWNTNQTDGINVVGELTGSDPTLKEQVVMLGGHLDSWHAGTGATDNAAGCAVMMEAMRIIKSLPVQPKRTIRIALWGGEEQGLLGSFGYVKKHYGDPKDMKLSAEQKKVSAYFNLDNGTGKIRGIFAQGNPDVVDLFQSWLAPFNDLGATTVTPKNTGSTDHLSFDAVGIPGFEFIQDPIEYETRTHHTNMDVYDHLLIDDLKQASAIVAAFVYNTAMRDEMIPRKALTQPQRFLFDLDVPF
ncbi:MAG TPA: M20/M25/M40 family metallo-hydrolase [Flavitalea sp.]|nr:M20/M25/M40 family metallo-hydrolase [Flavitalea sp.]